jgi:hypothetical protein
MKFLTMLAMLAVSFFFVGCSGATKPEPDANQDIQETNTNTPDEEVSVEPTTSSKDYEVSSEETEQVLYKASLGPFFKVSAYVPYKVKVEFENQITKVREHLQDDKNLKIKVTAYYPAADEKEKRFASRRVRNLINYAGWREKLSKSYFVSEIVPTSDTEKFYTIDFELRVPEGTKTVTQKRTVYYTGQKVVKKNKDDVENNATTEDDKESSVSADDVKGVQNAEDTDGASNTESNLDDADNTTVMDED